MTTAISFPGATRPPFIDRFPPMSRKELLLAIDDLGRRPVRATRSRFNPPAAASGVTFFAPSSLPGFAFTRASSATDAAPEAGLPIDNVDTYAIDELRDVSAKLGETGWFLNEGASANTLTRSEELDNAAWGKTIATAVTVTPGESDPAGGTGASRIECAGSGDYVAQNMTGITTGPRTFSEYVRSGSGSGVFQRMNTSAGSGTLAEIAKGGTAAATWERTRLRSSACSGTGAARINDGTNWLASGGLAAGARDAVIAFPQGEALPFASSYIPTDTTSATRATEYFRFTPPSSWYDGSNVIVIEWRPTLSSYEMNLTSTHAGANPYVIGFNSATYIRILNGSLGTPTTSLRMSWSGGALTEGGISSFDAGDLLRFELHVKTGQLRIFVNGSFVNVRSLPFDPTDYLPGAGGWRVGGPWSGASSIAFGAFRIGVVASPEDEVTWDDFSADSTFSRASTASDGIGLGLIEDGVDTYAVDELRDVSAKLGESGWCLFEGARTNVGFTTLSRNSTGTAMGSTVTASYESPSGEANVSLYETAATNSRTQVSTLNAYTVDGTVYTASMFAKAESLPTDGDVSFDVQIRDGSFANLPITLTNAWKRHSQSLSFGTGAGNTLQRIYNGDADVRQYSQAFNQVEAGAHPSSYIDAPATTTARAADVLTKDANAYDSIEGDKIVIEWRPERDSTEAADTTNNWLFRTSAGRGVYVSGTTNTIGIVTTATTYVSSYGLVFSKGDRVRIEIDVANSIMTASVNGVRSKASRILGAGATFGFTGLATYIGSSGAGGDSCFGLLRLGSVPAETVSPLS